MLVTVVFPALVFTGCSGKSGPALASKARRSCPVTLPNRSVSRHVSGISAESFNHGNAAIRVSLWPQGKLVAGPLPDGGSLAVIQPDGSIDAKLGWWRGVEGKLAIAGRRLDGPAPPLRAHIPDGYGVSGGFQPTGVIFPTGGCWKVTGTVGGDSLSFVVNVIKTLDKRSPGVIRRA
jgi:hypothetical protein